MLLRLLLFALCFLNFSALVGKPLKIETGAKGVILINAETGVILFEKNPHKKLFPASTTKIATVLYSLKLAEGDLDQMVVAKSEALKPIAPSAKRQSGYRAPSYFLETDGTHISIKRGEAFRLGDLIHGALLASANDACNVLAEHFGGTILNFIDGLNAFLKELGCQNTHFTNPHGLHHPEHVTTAFDLALIAQAAMRDPFFREVVAKTRYTIPQTNLEYERSLLQGNKLLRSGANFYPQAIGIKTGYHSNARKTLVAAARENGRELISVVLGNFSGSCTFQETRNLFDAAFAEPLMCRTLFPSGPCSFEKKVKGGRGSVETFLKNPLMYQFFLSEEEPVKVTLSWHPLKLPIAAGAPVATLFAKDGFGRILSQSTIVAAKDCPPTLWYRMWHMEFFASNPKKKWLVFIAISLAFLVLLPWKKKTSCRRSRPLF